MKFRTLFLLFMVSLIVIPELSYQSASANTIQSTIESYLGDEIIISDRSSEEFSPAIAYNSTRDQYLVVWENVWPGGYHDIYAQRISSTGKLLSWFAVSSDTNSKTNPSVAYDPVNDRFLVVWAHDYWGNGSDWDIHGRFIPWNGPDPSLIDFTICDWNSFQAHPVVTYARSQEEYLVVWQSTSAGVPGYISGRRVFADGGMGDDFTISSGPQIRDFPDITYNLARNEYLVVWDLEINASNIDIYARRLRGDGIPLGDEFVIAGWPNFEAEPSVAACDKSDQYMVAWQSDQGTGGADYAIYARYVNGDAIPGNIYLIDDTTSPELNVDISCNASGRQYLLAWQTRYVNLKYGIWARIAFPNEMLEPQFPVVHSNSTQNREYPAIGGGWSSYLVAWEHEDATRDIHGRLLRNITFLPIMEK